VCDTPYERQESFINSQLADQSCRLHYGIWPVGASAVATLVQVGSELVTGSGAQLVALLEASDRKATGKYDLSMQLNFQRLRPVLYL
jgi:hypothetical protein